MTNRLSIGVDLGTSNSAVALAEQDHSENRQTEITQLAGPSSLVELPLLPSVLYLPHPAEYEPESLRLPWDEGEDGRDVIVGTFARDRGAYVPDRVINSAKSWLCNSQIDRRAPILPWGAEIGEAKRSPFEASRLILEHLRKNLELHWPQIAEGRELGESRVVLTVPASFDEAARTLTYEAAEIAGWPEVVLLEEPLAAFYAWIAAVGESWREQITPGDIVLVCDVGGGTSDFSLIAVDELDGELSLRRVSVGEHLLLGGDNMDLTLAYMVRANLDAQGKSIDSWQFLALIQLVRSAKERLLGETSLDSVPLSLPSRGSGLFQSTITAELTRTQVEQVLLEGFLPFTAADELPVQGEQVGLQELGLGYAAEPALSKHLAAFLAQSLRNVASDPELQQLISSERVSPEGILKPTKILFNGGVFNAPIMRARVIDVLNRWVGEQQIVELEGAELDLAVAKGAAAYGAIRLSGKGLRVRAGTARSYYIGVEASMPAVPGFSPPVRGVCVVPQGTEEGSSMRLDTREFGLRTGMPVSFRLFSSTIRAGDSFGNIVEDADRELEELPRLEVTLPAEDEPVGRLVPVKLNSVVTELGTLELWMEDTRSDQRWKLEFNLRGDQAANKAA